VQEKKMKKKTWPQLIVSQGFKQKVFLEEATTFPSDLKFPEQLKQKKKNL
jgi:hypothetical protein